MRYRNQGLATRMGLFVPRAFSAALITVLLCALEPRDAGARQVPQAPPSFHQSQPPGQGPDESVPLSGSSAQKLEHMRQDDRRKHLVSDTAKLLELSTELKSEVEKSSKDELSLEVVRKAAEIEKLAHDVKERMKG